MKRRLLLPALLPVIAMTGSAAATLAIYEPFDYAPTEVINDGVFLGDGNQGGGLGLGTWSQVDNNGNTTVGSPPMNEADVAITGVTFTDSLGNDLPVAGNAWVRRNRTGQIATSSPIDPAATAALTADNTTMWMSFLFQDFGFSGPDFGIGLATEKMVGNDNQSLETAGYGVGFGINSTGGTLRNIGTVVYNNSTEFTRVPETTATFDGPSSSPVYLLALKVNWNASGTPDEVFAFIIDDINNAPDESAAVAMDSFDFDLATQQALDVLNISDTQVGYVDEVRVGTTFSSVMGASPKLTLRVDTVTGEMSILGDPSDAVSFNFYQVTSATESLDFAGWDSLTDQDYEGNGPPDGTGNGWEEGGGSGDHALGEAYLLDDSTLAPSEVISLGSAYDTAIEARDLAFWFRNDAGRELEGLVQYVATVLPGDTDGDGDIDDADLGTSFANYTGPVGAAGGKTAAQGDTDGDGDVDDSDLGNSFSGYTGPLGPANVPEPAGIVLLGLGVLGLARRRRYPRSSKT